MYCYLQDDKTDFLSTVQQNFIWDNILFCLMGKQKNKTPNILNLLRF